MISLLSRQTQSNLQQIEAILRYTRMLAELTALHSDHRDFFESFPCHEATGTQAYANEEDPGKLLEWEYDVIVIDGAPPSGSGVDVAQRPKFSTLDTILASNPCGLPPAPTRRDGPSARKTLGGLDRNGQFPPRGQHPRSPRRSRRDSDRGVENKARREYSRERWRDVSPLRSPSRGRRKPIPNRSLPSVQVAEYTVSPTPKKSLPVGMSGASPSEEGRPSKHYWQPDVNKSPTTCQ